MLKFNQSIINFIFMKKINKIVLTMSIFFLVTFNSYSFTGDKSNTNVSSSSKYFDNNINSNSLFTPKELKSLKDSWLVDSKWNLTDKWKEAAWTDATQCWNNCAKSLKSSAAKAAWAGWPDDLTSTDFIINVDSISPWINSKWSNTTERVNWILWTLIQNMMIWLWILSVLIMTIWSGYIIFHNWQDELLSKGKSIFMSWVYAMIIALTSYYLVSIVRYMLYS